jgi:hypothetical protein
VPPPYTSDTSISMTLPLWPRTNGRAAATISRRTALGREPQSQQHETDESKDDVDDGQPSLTSVDPRVVHGSQPLSVATARE